jgi:hypothetical protein
MRISILLLLLSTAGAQQLPVQGWLGGDPGIRPLIAISGTLLTGAPVHPSGRVLAGSSEMAVIARGDRIEFLRFTTGERFSVPGSPSAKAGIHAGVATAAIPERGELWIWSDGEAVVGKLDPGGEVLAVVPGAMVVGDGTRAWIAGGGGDREPLPAGVEAAVLWPDRAVLCRRGRQLLFRSPWGEEQALPADAHPKAQLVRIGGDWVQAGEHQVIRRRGNHVETFLIPGAGPGGDQ